MKRRLLPFEIQIEAAGEAAYRVEARFLGTVRSAETPTELPLLKRREIEQARSWLERGFIDIEYARDFGGRLFQTFFQGEVLDLFQQAILKAGADDGLRLILNLPMPASLDDLPWELLYDAQGGNGFLARSDTTALVRHFTDLPLPHDLPAEGPLRVLLAAASPRDKPPISQEKEAEAIFKSLHGRRLSPLDAFKIAYQHVLRSRSLKGLARRLKQRSLVEFDALPHATRASLQRRLLERRNAGQGYHVIHFAGHGDSDENGSFLALEDESGASDLITAEEFAELIDGPEVNLVVLNACKSAAAENAVKSLAETPLRRGIPAVIGMQVPVLDRAAVEFAREFYALWASGEPLESALGYARRLISAEKRSQAADWSIPVLYMGPQEGLTLAMEIPSIQTPRPVRLLRWAMTAVISLVGTVTLLLSVPDTASALRRQVPYLRCNYPNAMSEPNKFNVVVTDFPIVDGNNQRLSGGEGRLLADEIYFQLDGTFKETGLVPEIRPPAETCPLLGTEAERKEQARQLADDIQADMVIYGIVRKLDSGLEFKPEFYVSYRGFTQADEVIGEHELGRAVPLPGDLDEATIKDITTGIGARNQALVDITIGLAYYSLDNMLEAASRFEKAHDLTGWPESAQGKEVIHMMWGNALARQASHTVLEVISKEIGYEEWKANLDAARLQYQAALDHNGFYPRAKVGLASVYTTLARGEPGRPDAPIDLDLLNYAEILYDEAAAAQAEPELMIPAKVNFGLGQIYLARAQNAQRQARGAPDRRQAEEHLRFAGKNQALAQQAFAKTLEIYHAMVDEALQSRIKFLASHANANLALIRLQGGDVCGALPYVIEADRLATPYYRARYSAFLGQTYEMLGDSEAALAAYNQGYGEAYGRGDDDSMRSLGAKIAELENQPVRTPEVPCLIPAATPKP